MSRELRTISGFAIVGKLGKTHGPDGEIRIYPADGCRELLEANEFLFADIQGSKVPFRVEHIRGDGILLVKFIKVESAEEAARMVNCDIFLPADETPFQPVQRPSALNHARLAGYTMVDERNGVIGTIRSVEAYPEQEMAIVEDGGAELLVPLNDTFIVGIDHSDQRVTVDLPGGLLDVQSPGMDS